MFGNSNIGTWDFLTPFSENSQQWGTSPRFNRNTQESMSTGMYEMSTSPQIMAKIDGLYQKIDAFTASEPYPHHPLTFCATCSSPTHPTHSCPYNVPYPEFREDQNSLQNFHSPSHNNYCYDTQNPDWARHPNFPWFPRSYQDSPIDSTHHNALYPQYPQPPV